MDLVASSPGVSSSLRFANGAIGGQTMAQWAVPGAKVWSDAVQRIQGDGLNTSQVQVVWMKMGSKLDQLPGTQGERIEQERQWLDAVITNASNTFPNLKRIYISSRIYAGYANTPNHSEPQTGYDNGFAGLLGF